MRSGAARAGQGNAKGRVVDLANTVLQILGAILLFFGVVGLIGGLTPAAYEFLAAGFVFFYFGLKVRGKTRGR